MKFEISDRVSNKLRNMSIICALLVVIIHCRPHFEHASLAWWVKEVLENGVCEMAVPFFFLVSGFFIAAKIFDGVYKDEIVKRVRTLLVPYFCWVLMFLSFGMCVSRRFFVPSLGQMGFDPFCCPALSPLWYVRALFCLALLSPVILFCLKRCPRVTLITLACLYGLICPYVPMPCWGPIQDLARVGPLPVLGLFYFSLGMAIRLGMFNSSNRRVLSTLCVIVGIALIAFRAISVYSGKGWIGAYCGFFAIPFLMYGGYCLMPEKSMPKIVVAASFPIYVIHKFFYPIVLHWCDKNTLFGYLFASTFVFCLSFVTSVAIRKWLPRFAAVVFGGR